PNDQFPKAPGPDKEILARRADAERAMMKEQAAETGTDPNDETAGKAKSAAQDEDKPVDRGRPPAGPGPGDSERLQRPPGREPRPPATDIDRTPPRRPPVPRLEDDGPEKAKAKRGKNG